MSEGRIGLLSRRPEFAIVAYQVIIIKCTL